MKKFSLIVVCMFLLACIMPLAANAAALPVNGETTESPAPSDGNDDTSVPPDLNDTAGLLALDKEYPLSNGSYASGYTPTSYKSGNQHLVKIHVPLKYADNVESKVQGYVEISPVPVNDLKPSNKMRKIDSAEIGAVSGQAPPDFELEVASETYNGTYPAQFEASYTGTDGIKYEQVFTIFFAVTGKAMPSEGGGEAPSGNQPRVMVTKYETDKELIEAGGEFQLDIEFTNQSKSKSVRNIKITMNNEGGVFLPADGTNTAYVDSLGAGKSVTKTFHYTVSPDAEPKPSSFGIELVYEDGSGTEITDNAMISLSVSQPMRIKIDNPQVQPAYEGEPIYVSMGIFNLGKSPIYNLMATVEGTGLSVEQSYYGGTLEGGASKTVELAVIAGVGAGTGNGGGDDLIPEGEGDGEAPTIMPRDGMEESIEPMVAPLAAMDAAIMPGGIMGGEQQVSGKIKLTYEDAQGKEYEEYREFTATISSFDPGFEEPIEEPEPEKKFPWIWVIVGAVILIIAVVILLVLRKRKRDRALEDELL
ncbi:MAG: COG1361 S-layer family protein [Christensenellaceae bacterium]|jgi:hypothetical protein